MSDRLPTRFAAAMTLATVTLLAALLAAPLAAQGQETRPAVWSADQEVDLALGAFEDSSLVFVLTARPDPNRHFELMQPFQQQPSAALEDFGPVAPNEPPCIPVKGKNCP